LLSLLFGSALLLVSEFREEIGHQLLGLLLD
jgi:hypothetical protein